MKGKGYVEGESWKTGSAGKRQRVAIYIDWLLTPVGERSPVTKTDLAKKLDITVGTLRTYTQDPALQREIADRARAEAKVERLPDILRALYEQAIDTENPRSVAAARTYMDFLTKTEDVREMENLEEMSNDDLVRLVSETLARQSASE